MGIKLELSIAQTNLILGALGKQPYEVDAGVVDAIQAQGGPQVEAVAAEEAAAAEAAKAEAAAAE